MPLPKAYHTKRIAKTGTNLWRSYFCAFDDQQGQGCAPMRTWLSVDILSIALYPHGQAVQLSFSRGPLPAAWRGHRARARL